MGRTNFTECAARYLSEPRNQTLIDLYGWTGNVTGISKNEFTQISLAGCRKFCGTGNDYYAWKDASNTITTWVLPIAGILLQAPFASNAFRETIFSLARWVGSPMASLAYVLWNIKVTGKTALIVDMATPCDEIAKDVGGDFGSVRDSLYILTAMNQYSMRSSVREKKEAEGLLRITLFSKDLRLLRETSPAAERIRARSSIEPQADPTARQATTYDLEMGTPDADLEPERYLNTLRQKLAQDMRMGRRRGVVPVFISTLWFLFALALSIQAAFGQLGQNAQAHDLALGCLLAWLPVLILGTIVDRNPVSSEDIRAKLNDLVERVRISLMDGGVRARFLQTINDQSRQQQMQDWVGRISEKCPSMGEFFVEFAGQGRKRWFYGCAHPILSDIERAYIADEGRGWLHDEQQARTLLVLGHDMDGIGLDWLDYRELWQVLAAVLVVGGTVLGAFVLSFFTPTVGLGCRSGGYTIFGTIAFGLLIVEMSIWWIVDATKPALAQLGQSITRRLTNNQVLNSRSAKAYITIIEMATSVHAAIHTAVYQMIPSRYHRHVDEQWNQWKEYSVQKKLDLAFFKPIECFNSAWLVYITVSQTFGAYRNCSCMSSIWGGHGGYIDFTQYDTTTSSVHKTWISGTVISTSLMAGSMAYIVVEWCLQSHMSTADFGKAMKGLRGTRRYRRVTNPFRIACQTIVEIATVPWKFLLRQCGWKSQPRRSLRWTRNNRSRTVEYELQQIARDNSQTAPLMTDSPDAARVYDHYPNTPSPRPSNDAHAAPWTPSPIAVFRQDFLFPRPTYERQTNSAMASEMDDPVGPPFGRSI